MGSVSGFYIHTLFCLLAVSAQNSSSNGSRKNVQSPQQEFGELKYFKVADSLLFPLSPSSLPPISPLSSPNLLKSKVFSLPLTEYFQSLSQDVDTSSTSKLYKNSLTLIRISFQQQQKSVFLFRGIYEVVRLKLHSSYAIPRESFFFQLKYNCSVLNKQMVSLGR